MWTEVRDQVRPRPEQGLIAKSEGKGRGRVGSVSTNVLFKLGQRDHCLLIFIVTVKLLFGFRSNPGGRGGGESSGGPLRSV